MKRNLDQRELWRSNALVEKKKGIFSEKEMTLFRWMCFHIYLGGTPTSNPNNYLEEVFKYFHGAMGAQCEFMYDKMTGPGITGMYASCGYTKYSKEMDSWMMRKWNMSRTCYRWHQTFMSGSSKESLQLPRAWCWWLLELMNAHQQHHLDVAAVLSLTDREWEWELRCQQWHIYKRDLGIGNCFSVVPAADVRYEKVCAYLEALTRLEVQESPGKTDAKAWVTVNPTKCTFCSFYYKTYENMGNAASAVWSHVHGCAETNLSIRGEGPKFPDSKMICMDAMRSPSSRPE